MTPQEFKKKYPHLAHLEGNALWDAMEDAWLFEHQNDNVKPITDWKGNLIKEGDEICVIRIVDRPMFTNMTLMIPKGLPGEFEAIKSPAPDPEPKECWEIDEYKLVMPGLMYESKAGEFTFHCHISMIHFLLDKDHVLAIKGVSDKNPND